MTEEVAEDGLLFSTRVRYSEDSTSPPSMASSSSLMNKEPSIYEAPPELGPLEIESSLARRSLEWDHIMKSVLATATEQCPDMHGIGDARVVLFGGTDVEEERRDVSQSIPLNFSIMSQEQIEELNSGLEAELGLNAALDLGFGQKQGSSSKWFDLLQIPGSSRASSPSVYSSQAVTFCKRSPVSHASDDQFASIKAETGEANPEPMSSIGSTPWWRRMVSRFRRAQTWLTFPKTPSVF